MNTKQWAILFARRDVRLIRQRKEIFFSHDLAFEPAQPVSVLYNFDLRYEQFGELIKRTTDLEGSKKAWEDLALLTRADDLKLVFYDALSDVLKMLAGHEYWSDSIKAWQKLERKIVERVGWQYEYYLWELRIYRLAKYVVPWKRSDAHQTTEFPETGHRCR